MLDDLPSSAPDESAWHRAMSVVAAARANPRRVAGVGIAVAVVGLALWWLLRPPPPVAPERLLPVVTTTPDGVAVASPTVGASGAPTGASSTVVSTVDDSVVVVHVVGAVAHPGVLRLPAGARVVDAIDAAGGPSADADTARINLAALVADGGWIHVPRAGEDVPPTPPGTPSAGGGTGSPDGAGTGASTDPVDLNTASVEQLDTLPGVGPATASAIVEHRTRNGPFASVDGLTDVPGIGPAKLERLRPLVRV